MGEQIINATTSTFDLIISFYAMVNETADCFIMQNNPPLRPHLYHPDQVAYNMCSINISWTELNF